MIIGGENGDQPVVAFYNPWADVILITAWQYDAGRPKIFDVEMAPAEVVRSGLENFDLVPQWKKSNQYRPMAVGETVADTVLAFELLFPPSSAISKWREKLGYLKRGPDFLDGLYAAAGLMLQGHMPSL